MKKNIFNNSFSYENLFYLTCSQTRISKLIAQFLVFNQSIKVKGSCLEFGVFKGNSLFRLLNFKKILRIKKYFYAFDLFGEFKVPQKIDDDDLDELKLFFKEAGNKSVSISFLNHNLKKRKLNENVRLIKGDIKKTLVPFLKKRKKEKFAFINLDVDLYDVTYFILEKIWPRVSQGGVVWFDDYGENKENRFPGATRAIKKFIRKNKNAKLKKIRYDINYYYCVKK